MGRKTRSQFVSMLRLRRGGGVLDLLQGVARDLLDPYRPELHYMRGPGPKWHAKHAPAAVPARAPSADLQRAAV